MTTEERVQAALGAAAEEGNNLAVVCSLIAAAAAEERERCIRLILEAADRQAHYAEPIYTHISDSERQQHLHAERMLRAVAAEIRRGPHDDR